MVYIDACSMLILLHSGQSWARNLFTDRQADKQMVLETIHYPKRCCYGRSTNRNYRSAIINCSSSKTALIITQRQICGPCKRPCEDLLDNFEFKKSIYHVLILSNYIYASAFLCKIMLNHIPNQCSK